MGGKLEEIRLTSHRFAAQLSVVYCTFSRYEETAALKPKDIVKEGLDILVLFPKGKQFQFGEARTGMMPSMNQLAVNPVQVLMVYIEKLLLLTNEESFLFPAFQRVGNSLQVVDRAANYESVLHQFRKFYNTLHQFTTVYNIYNS